MTFQGPVQTLQNRITQLRSYMIMFDSMSPRELAQNKFEIDATKQEIEEHERAVEYLRQIIHILEIK